MSDTTGTTNTNTASESDSDSASDSRSKKAEDKMFKEFQGNKAFPENLAELFDGCADDQRKVLSERAEKNLEDL